VKKRAKVIVLGDTVYRQLFPEGDNPVGKLIRVNNIGIRCIGVLAPKGASGSNNADDLVVAPATTAQKRIFAWLPIRTFSLRAVSEDKMDEATEQVDAIFRKRYRVKEGDPSTIVIRNQAEVASFAEQSQNTFTALLAGIAGVSLLVGGIGIMNIMLVSVTERTREIGIRKAIGAKRRDVLAQFLIEAVVLSLLGGLIGIGLGIGIAKLLPLVSAESSTVITLAPVVLSFGFAAAVGVFFGFYPAQKASKLEPIVALRYE
jgi:putative ABC transport system permease protein